MATTRFERMERLSSDDLQTIPSRNRSPPRSPFLAALLRRQSKNEHPSQIKFKEQRRIVVLGAAKVGKSAIIQQFLYDQFTKKYNKTVEDLYVAEYNLSSGASLTLEILDTTGSYQFPAMRALSISNGNAFLLVYSVDDEESWKQLKELRHQVCSHPKFYKMLFFSCNFANFVVFFFLRCPDYLCSRTRCSNRHCC